MRTEKHRFTISVLVLGLTLGAGWPEVAAAIDSIPVGSIPVSSRGVVDQSALRSYLTDRITNSRLNGYVPADGAKYGVDGSVDSWVNHFMSLAEHESGFRVRARNDADPGGSLGLFQVSKYDGGRYGANPAGRNWTEGELFDPAANASTAVSIYERNVLRDGQIVRNGSSKGAGGYFAGTTMKKVARDASSGKLGQYDRNAKASGRSSPKDRDQAGQQNNRTPEASGRRGFSSNEGFRLTPTAKDRCAYSATMDQGAECDSSYAKIDEAKVVDLGLQLQGSQQVQDKGEQEIAAVELGGTTSMVNPMHGALEASTYGAQVLESAAKVNIEMSLAQEKNATRHREMIKKLRDRINDEQKEIKAIEADLKDLSSSGRDDGSRYSFEQSTVKQFRMNQVGTVLSAQQECQKEKLKNQSGLCPKAEGKRKAGLGEKKKKVARLMDDLKRLVQKEQKMAMKASEAGAKASYDRAQEQLKSANSAREVADEVSRQLSDMSNAGDGETPAMSLLSDPRSFELYNGEPVQVRQAIPVDPSEK